jgi:hypothetical protein
MASWIRPPGLFSSVSRIVEASAKASLSVERSAAGNNFWCSALRAFHTAQCGWTDSSFQLSRDIVRLVRDTGMRNGRELYRMRIENLDWAKRNIFVPDSKTPEGRRTIPMSERVFQILRPRCGTKTSGWVFPSRRKTAKFPSPWLDCGSLSGGTKESGPSGKTGPLLRASRFWHHGRQPDGQPEGGDEGDGPQGCQNRDEVPTSGNRHCSRSSEPGWSTDAGGCLMRSREKLRHTLRHTQKWQPCKLLKTW